MDNFVNKIKTKDSTEYAIHDERIDNVDSGTIVNALGLNADGELVKGAVSGGGTKLYKHTLTKSLSDEGGSGDEIVTLITDKNDNIPTFTGSMLVISGSAVFSGGGTPVGVLNGMIPLTNISYPTVMYPHNISVIDFAEYQLVILDLSGFTDTVTEL